MNRRQKLVQQQFLNDEKAVINRLEQVYKQALKDIDGNIEKLMKRFDPETGDLPQSAVYQLKYQKMLRGQVEGILNRMQDSQYVNVSDYLNGCYEDGFIGGLFDLHGQGVPLTMPINQESLVRAVQLDSKISQGLYTRLGEDVGLLKKKILAQVSRSIATNMSFAQTANLLARQTRIGFNRAIRITRTEGHRIQNQAIMDSAHGAKERGADLVKQWDATLDGKTRDSHVAVDGEIRELDETFSNGLEFPGDPAGGAAQVVNCRCVMLQRARWAVGGSFTKWNNFTRQLETFDSPESYDEFKKGFFSDGNKRYMNYVQDLEKKYGTRDFTKVLDRMTDREYAHYSKLLAKNPVYNKGERKSSVPNTVTVKRMTDVTDFSGMDSYLSTAYNMKLDASVKGLDFENVRDALIGCETMFDEFPDLVDSIKDITTDKSGIMACDGTQISFNPYPFAEHNMMLNACKQNAASGWWPKNTTIASIGAHECAHGVEWLMITANPNYIYDFQRVEAWNECSEAKLIVSQACKNIKKTPYGKGKKNAELINSISRYAGDTASETMAEAFADIYANGENASPLSVEIKRLTIERYKMYKGE